MGHYSWGTKHYETRYRVSIMLSDANKYIMLSVIMMNYVMLSIIMMNYVMLSVLKYKLLGPKIQIQNISLILTNNVHSEYENKFVRRSQDVLSMVLQDFDFFKFIFTFSLSFLFLATKKLSRMPNEMQH